MSIKIKAVDSEKMEAKIEIDVDNTKDLASNIEALHQAMKAKGLTPKIKYVNFPILNKYKNLNRQLQHDIRKLILEKIEIERKVLSDMLYERSIKKKLNTLRPKKIKNPAVVAEMIKIVDENKKKFPNNFWDIAHARCIEYLWSINSDKSEDFINKSKDMFIQYIRRNRKKINGN